MSDATESGQEREWHVANYDPMNLDKNQPWTWPRDWKKGPTDNEVSLPVPMRGKPLSEIVIDQRDRR